MGAARAPARGPGATVSGKVQQLDLFNFSSTEEIRLRVAAEQARQRALQQIRYTSDRPLCALQLALWGDPVMVCMPIRRPVEPVRRHFEVIPAGPLAAASVFALAAGRPKLGRKWHRPAAAEAAPHRVERDGDRVRLVRMLPQETPEWQERERQRRARQKPPRPPKKAKTRSRKLLEIIGDVDDDIDA